MISLTFLWKNGTNIANGKFKFGELRKSELCAQTRASSPAGGMPVW